MLIYVYVSVRGGQINNRPAYATADLSWQYKEVLIMKRTGLLNNTPSDLDKSS